MCIARNPSEGVYGNLPTRQTAKNNGLMIYLSPPVPQPAEELPPPLPKVPTNLKQGR